MRLSLTLLLAALTALVVCPKVHAEEAGVYVEDLACVGGPLGMDLPSDLRVLKQLSPGLEEELLEIEHWQEHTTTRKLLTFEGLALVVIEFSSDPARYMVTYAVISNERWNAISPFKIGRPVAESEKASGAHARSNPGLRQPFVDEVDRVTVDASNGIVTRVTYECYPH